MHTAVLDGEWRSVTDLREAGANVYANDPTTTPLRVVVIVDSSEPQVWRSEVGRVAADPPLPVFFEIAANPSNWELVAHNVGFDRPNYDSVLVARYGFPPLPLSVWHCSQQLALANSYPAELDLLAQALGLPYRKDPAARKAMLAVSRPMQRKRKTSNTPIFDEDPVKLKLTEDRCILDTITADAIWRSPKLKHLSPTERHYQLQDMAINERGIRGDRAFITAARDFAICERAAINLKLQELTAGTITSVDQSKRFLAAINARGHNMTTLNKRAVAQVLARKPDEYVRQLLELRRTAARASVNKFRRMLAYMAPADDRIRGTLRMFGAGPGRWAGLGPQLQNLKKNESNLPLSLVDSVRNGDRNDIARYGNPLSLLGDISRAALCASPGMELKSGDFSAIESVVLAWLAGETWKLLAYKTFQETGDTQLEPYRVIARKMLQKPADAEISSAERQLGKGGELSGGFGGSVGAWRRIVPHDPRSDAEIAAIIRQWREAHPATRKFWKELARAIRVTIRTGQPILVAPPPQPPIVAAFSDGNLTVTLPSGRAITYPEARLVPGKFEDAPSDVQFTDNARGQWKPYRGWFGTFVENVVQGTARDLLAGAIERFETRGIDVVFHCHDEVTAEVPIGSLSDKEFLDILLQPPDWTTGWLQLPLAGKVHSGPHYLAPPEQAAEPLVAPNPDDQVIEDAVDSFIADTREHIELDRDPVQAEREDDVDFLAELESGNAAPLTEMVSLPLSAGNKVCCPFHDDPFPSCAIYVDHFHCYGCGERGSRLDWLMRVEGLTVAEAIATMKDWPGTPAPIAQNDDAEKLAFVKSIWTAAQPLLGSLAERYLAESRHIDTAKLPADIHRSLRFHPNCVFGAGNYLPCLVVLMRHPVSDAPVGIQRIALEQRNGKVEKLERRMLGRGGVVKLWPVGPRLVVGEGLETALAAATRIPYRDALLQPAWAALSSGALGALPVIAGVQELIILVDHDNAGQMAAERCSQRWSRSGRRVVRLKPKRANSDFNDLVMGAAS